MAPTVWCVVVAAGRGARFGGAKQYEPLGDQRVVDWAVADAAAVRRVRPTASCSWSRPIGSTTPSPTRAAPSWPAGATRSASVRAGLAAVPADGRRRRRARRGPSLRRRRPVRGRGRGGRAAAPTQPCPAWPSPTPSSGSSTTRCVETIDRTDLVAVQTPQAFRAERAASGPRGRSGGDRRRRAGRGARRPGGGRARTGREPQDHDARRPRAGPSGGGRVTGPGHTHRVACRGAHPCRPRLRRPRLQRRPRRARCAWAA